MKQSTRILMVMALLGAITLPTTVAKAGPGTNPLVHVSFCRTGFYFATDDYPNLYIDRVDVYDPGGTLVERIDVFGHNAESRDVGYAIGRAIGTWGEVGLGIISEAWATAPSCGGGGLMNMYVYYSATPFFGETNTITLFSADGFPSVEAVTAAAGGKLPEGFTYGAPACWGVLYDDGTDKGRFDCDTFLANLGERRAWLRNDPEGPGFDLLPKIEKYLGMLRGMGITPQAP
jgi:hypothetical protein